MNYLNIFTMNCKADCMSTEQNGHGDRRMQNLVIFSPMTHIDSTQNGRQAELGIFQKLWE